MSVSNSERTIRDLLEQAGVEVNGGDPWDIQVHEPRFYERALNETSLG